MREHRKEETALFYTGWAIVFLMCLLLILYRLLPLPYDKLMAPCVLHSISGLYCPGCGGTRAILALLNGHVITSFICHPLVPYTAITGGWFLISQSIERISKRRVLIGMKFHDAYVWAALFIVVINFIAKNMLLIVWHIDLLEGTEILLKPLFC